VLQTRSRLDRDIQLDSQLASDAGDLRALAELAEEGEDVIAELTSEVEKLEQEAQHTEIRMLLSGEHDASNAIVTVHPGAGGSSRRIGRDAGPHVPEMERAFRLCHEDARLSAGRGGGHKVATFLVEGDYVYGYLSSESGVHRLVRISPFGAMGKRQTSFASVFVYPQLDETIDIQIDEKTFASIPTGSSGRRRPARQRHRLCRSHHAHSDRNRGFLPE